MNCLFISSIHQPINTTNNKNNGRNSFVINNLNKKIFNNKEYGPIFANNAFHGNLKKSCSVNEDINLMKINSINSFYVQKNSKYLDEKKMKIEDAVETINNNINNTNAKNKNEKEKAKNLVNDNCYIL